MVYALLTLMAAGIIVESAVFYHYVKTHRPPGDGEFFPESDGRPVKPVSKGSCYRVAIEILDPVSIARRESKLAGIITGLAPNLIVREVYKRVRKEVARSMEERGIESRVTVITVLKFPVQMRRMN